MEQEIEKVLNFDGEQHSWTLCRDMGFELPGSSQQESCLD